jgi:hypothetical protein
LGMVLFYPSRVFVLFSAFMNCPFTKPLWIIQMWVCHCFPPGPDGYRWQQKAFLRKWHLR